MDYILALDQGTTSSRAIIFDGAGKPVASHASELRQIFPPPNGCGCWTTRASVTTRLSILGADSPCNTPDLAAASNSEFVRFAVQHEFARTVEDILAQRYHDFP